MAVVIQRDEGRTCGCWIAIAGKVIVMPKLDHVLETALYFDDLDAANGFYEQVLELKPIFGDAPTSRLRHRQHRAAAVQARRVHDFGRTARRRDRSA